MIDIYFDNAATTKVDPVCIEVMNKMHTINYANPSAKHRAGFLVENEINEATKKVANILSCDPSEIIWTSGGTESNNFAIRSIVDSMKRMGNHLITSNIEHASVKNVFKYLESEGFEVTYINVDKYGKFDIKQIENSLNVHTIMVSLMQVNNEIGTVENIEEISKIIKNFNDKIVFHVDAVQSFGKVKLIPKSMGIDSFSVSGHKLHGPKGVGFLYLDKNVKINPLILGGGQQRNMRSGTLNTPGIIGLTKAIEKVFEANDEYINYLISLRDYFIDKMIELDNKISGIHFITQKTDDFAPHIVAFAAKSVRAEVLLHALEDKNIYVSSGSACSSKNKKISDTLTAIELDKDLQDNAIRVSFSKYNDKTEIDKFIYTMVELIPMLRRFSK